MAAEDRRAELIATFQADRPLAHQVLFAHRHPKASPLFHDTLIMDWTSNESGILHMVFRHGAKSTLAEEGLLLGACFREFRYALIVGNTIDRACQRLHSIRHEAETNDQLHRLFGPLAGPIWSVDQLMFSNQVMIQAIGRGQAMLGIKHLDQRPDMLLGDDLEERSDVLTEKQREATWTWFNNDLLPALARPNRKRLLATPRHPDALPMRVERDLGWLTRRIPVYRLDDHGERVSAWPEVFPMTKRDALLTGMPETDSIEHMEHQAARSGGLRDFNAEYLVRAEASEEKPFKREMLRIVPQFRSWHPVFCMFDPARTTHATSSRTGFAAWSWIGTKLVVWEAWGQFLQPSEVVDQIFRVEETYHPVHIGVEEDGLNEWLLQPIRTRQAELGIVLPLKAQRAPKGKLDFIRSLHGYFNAREVEFVQSLPDLESELLSFPNGKMDVPNALAYALAMKRGRPIYTDFSERNIVEGLEQTRSEPAWLALNATRTVATGVLVQLIDGAIRIHADWIKEDEPAAAAPWIVQAARMANRGRELYLVAPPLHFDTHNNIGVRQAIEAMPDHLDRGTDPALPAVRQAVRDLLQRELRGLPAVLISDKARWTAAAFSGGYAHTTLKHGELSPHAEEGTYRVLMEGLESLIGRSRARSTPDEDADTNYSVGRDGRRYKSMLRNRSHA